MKNEIANPIINRIFQIDKKFVEDLDLDVVPSDPDEFLEWWWTDNAKDCAECPLSSTRNHVVKPDGTSRAKIMIIGEGPGFLEDLTQSPLVGPIELKSSHCSHCSNVTSCFDHKILKSTYAIGKSAKVVKCSPNYTNNSQLPYTFYLRSSGSIIDGILLKKWKFTYARQNWIDLYNKKHPSAPLIHESPWYITNVTLCRSTDISGLRDMSPESVPRQKCKKWLTYQWAALNPDLIVCFGRIALGVLLGNEKAAKSVTPNTFVDTKFGKVLFQNHPAWFMREKSRVVKAYGFAKIASTLEKALDYVGLPTS